MLGRSNGSGSGSGGTVTKSNEQVNVSTSIGTFNFWFQRYGDVVTVQYFCSTTAAHAVGGWSLGTSIIPESYRPTITAVRCPICRHDSGTQWQGVLVFNADGSITYGQDVAGVSGVWIIGSGSWIIV